MEINIIFLKQSDIWKRNQPGLEMGPDFKNQNFETCSFLSFFPALF
jgi:hypothetical protein